MNIEKLKVEKSIGPQKIIHNGDVYQIVNYPQKYFISDYKITLINGKIHNVYVNGKHPNAEPSTGKFCIPNDLRKVDFNKNVQKLLEIIIAQYNLNNCYFTPWNEIHYKKQEV